MIKEKHFDTWQELQTFVVTLQQQARASRPGVSDPIFRGHPDAEWPLATTLERQKPRFQALADYFRVAAVAKTQIESMTSRVWDDLDYPSIAASFSEYDSLRFRAVPAYEFLAHIRHLGFPSPLLDWSHSLYVAAFFACNKASGDRVAIFAYQEFNGQGKAGSSSSPVIVTLGPYVRTHRRHFLQQGEYTMGCQFIDKEWCSVSHHSVFDGGGDEQDLVWKMTMPSKLASDVLRMLDEYNINAYSLFESEEALMETLAMRHFHFDRVV